MQKFFDWKWSSHNINGWDDIGPGEFILFDPTLRVDMGNLKAGTTFDKVHVNIKTGYLLFYNKFDELAGSFVLEFSIHQTS